MFQDIPSQYQFNHVTANKKGNNRAFDSLSLIIFGKKWGDDVWNLPYYSTPYFLLFASTIIVCQLHTTTYKRWNSLNNSGGFPLTGNILWVYVIFQLLHIYLCNLKNHAKKLIENPWHLSITFEWLRYEISGLRITKVMFGMKQAWLKRVNVISKAE